MEKIDFVNNTTPALNGRNLNKLQDNIEDAIEEVENAPIAVQYEQPTNGQELWLKKSKNLSPKEKTTTTNEKLGCHLKSGVTYSMSFDWSGSGMNIKENDNSGTTLRTIYGGTHITTTITPTQDCDVFINSWGVTEYPHNIMINEGSTALPYEPYDNSEILTKQDNSYNKFTDTVNVGVDSNNAGLWVETSKNLFNKNNVSKLNAYFNEGTPTITSSDANRLLYIPCKPNTTYSITISNATGTYSIGYTSQVPAIGVSVSGVSNTLKTITTDPNAKYLVLRYFQTVQATITEQQALDSIQIENGSTATSYEPYVEPNIKVFNNGQYETIVRKNVYSTEETIVGEFMGKTLYRKVISFGALPNNSGKSVAHGITNIDRVVDLKFIAQRGNDQSAGNFEALNISNSGNASSLGFNCYFNATNINIATNSDRSAYIGFLTVEYTKTTGGATLMSMLPPSNNEEE